MKHTIAHCLTGCALAISMGLLTVSTVKVENLQKEIAAMKSAPRGAQEGELLTHLNEASDAYLDAQKTVTAYKVALAQKQEDLNRANALLDDESQLLSAYKRQVDEHRAFVKSWQNTLEEAKRAKTPIEGAQVMSKFARLTPPKLNHFTLK